MSQKPAPKDKALASARQQIDEIDNQLVDLLIKRIDFIRQQIIPLKRKKGIEAYQPQRFAQLLERLKAKAAKRGLDPNLVEDIWNSIHASTVEEERTKLKDN